MPATALPSSGAEPIEPVEPVEPVEPSNSQSAAKLCDASGMAEIHRMFRAGFGEGPALVAGVRDGDAAQADVVGEHLAMLSIGLHAHHEGEDTKLWDQLETRAPSCAIHVGRMKEQHAVMLTHLIKLDAGLASWRESGSVREAASITEALTGINTALAVHLPDEEGNIVPVMERVLTPDEVEWYADHGRKATPKGKSMIQLGAILAAQPDGGNEWLHKRLPMPVRVIWRLIGRPKYVRYRATLVK